MTQDHPTPQAEPQLSNNTAASRYEARIDGEVAAFAEYRSEGGKVRFTHTEVQPAYEGRGLGKRLATYALDDVRAAGHKAVPQCSFIAQYIARHEAQYGDLVAKD